MGAFGWWLLAVGLAVALAVIVPYGLLRGGAPSLLTPLAWGGFGVAVVALVVAGIARWRV